MEFKSDLSLSEFQQFAARHPLGRYMQTFAQLAVTKNNKPVGCVGVYGDNGHLVAAAYYFVDHAKFGDVYSIKGGPLLDYSDSVVLDFFIQSCTRFFRGQGGLAFRITPPLDAAVLDDEGHTKATMNNELINHLARLGFRHVAQEPIKDNKYPGVGLGFEFRKDLTNIHSTDELRATYAKQTRNDVKRAERLGVYVKRLDYNELGEFKKQTALTADRRDFADKPLTFYQHAYQAFGDDVQFLMAQLNLVDFIRRNKDEITALSDEIAKIDDKLKVKQTKKLNRRRAEFEQQIQSKQRNIQQAQAEQQKYGDVITLSGGMFYTEPQEVAYMFSFNNKEFGNYHGQVLLQDYMLNQAVARKIPTYNFYMVTGNFDGTDGILKFKQSFGGQTYQTIGWFEKPLNTAKYQINRWMKKLLGRSGVR